MLTGVKWIAISVAVLEGHDWVSEAVCRVCICNCVSGCFSETSAEF